MRFKRLPIKPSAPKALSPSRELDLSDPLPRSSTPAAQHAPTFSPTVVASAKRATATVAG
jgi:hypothetical protein